MNRLVRFTIFLYYHLLAWNRLEALPVNKNFNISNSVSSNLNNQSDLHYAEGGVLNDFNKADATSSRTTLSQISGKAEFVLPDLLENGAPQTGTSKVKPRKEALPKTIVARKGAPPCLENENSPCLDMVPSLYESKTKSLPINPNVEQKTADNSSEIEASPLRIDLLNKLSTFAPAKKPIVTMVLPESDAFLVTIKNDRNVIIPVAALVCTPILVLLALFVYKRIEDARGNSQYTRMSFLIEDIYND